MKILYHIVSAIILCAIVSSCQSEERLSSSGVGWLRFNIDVQDNSTAPQQGGFSLYLSSEDGVYSHTWANIKDFPEYENYYVGRYFARVVSGEPTAEGYDCQCYMGERYVDVQEAKVAEFEILCSLHQAILNVSVSPAVIEKYSKFMLTAHSEGNSYVNVDTSKPNLLLIPGKTTLLITIENAQGKSITLSPNFEIETKAGEKTDIELSMNGDILTISSGKTVCEMSLTDDLFESEGPQVVASGFKPGVSLNLTEGFPASQNVEMHVYAPAGLSSVMLTTIGAEVVFQDFPKECDLINPNAALSDYGLVVDRISDKELLVHYNKMLENLSVADNSNLSFSLFAIDRLCRASEISTLDVNIKSVEFDVISCSPAVLGEEIASITLLINVPEIEASDFKIYELNENGDAVRLLPIVDSQIDIAANSIRLSFNIGNGVSDENVRVCYMDNPKLDVNIKRKVPEYQISVDPFATSAVIFFEGATQEVTELLVKYASVTANGQEVGILRRIPESGLIAISGLSPLKNYNIVTTIIPGSFAPSATIKTEAVEEVPSGDFEDFDVLIDYKGLKRGGVYSNTAIPLYNMQNYKDINVSWLQKHWASVNDKTFCEKAINHNTWYIEPSSMVDFSAFASGAKSVKIQTVGWSLRGEEILPYAQKEGEYIPYNANVPYVEHRSAGKLFLGSYHFDPATCNEVYKEGLPFNSRPSSLNGFYKYSVDPSNPADHGYVRIEIINDEGPETTVIASAEKLFDTSPDFIAFNLPLNYEIVGMKATKLRIMFASSSSLGTIEEEDESVKATPNVIEAAYLGSALWIDNLSFSY